MEVVAVVVVVVAAAVVVDDFWVGFEAVNLYFIVAVVGYFQQIVQLNEQSYQFQGQINLKVFHLLIVFLQKLFSFFKLVL